MKIIIEPIKKGAISCRTIAFCSIINFGLFIG
jgi:hypothetical protein